MIIKRFISLSGLVLATLAICISTYTMYVAQLNIATPFRVTISLLCFGSVFLTSAINLRYGIMMCLFLLPLMPNLTQQILAFTGYGRILNQNAPGLDAVSGLFLGSLFNYFFNPKRKTIPLQLPWLGSISIIFITLSAGLAIVRNLHQTESIGSLSILTYNLIHFRSLGWHHDYRPIFDTVAYGSAFALIAVLVPALRNIPDKNDVIFKPLLFGIVLAAMVGIIQSQTGRGLSAQQAFFRYDKLGFIAIGFQPDIHAFAAHMLIGAIGVIGYLYYTKKITLRWIICALVVPFGWAGLLVSKSKASIAISIASLILISLVWIFRHSRYLTKVLLICLSAFVFIAISFYVFSDWWLVQLTHIIQKLGVADLDALNVYMAYRPEIFAAGLRMFAEFPLLGLGQGDFYRLSANYPFSQSAFLSSTVNGENAHNYFLQVLAENGIIGFSILSYFVIYPILKIKNKITLLPASIGLGSIFLGNIYSHSLLVRENLFVVAALIALAYAWLYDEEHTAQNVRSQQHQNKNLIRILLLTSCFAIFIMAGKEVHRSFKQQPFKADKECFVSKPLTEDGWTSGIYERRLEDGVMNVRLHLKASQPDVNIQPLKGTISLVHDQHGILTSKEILITDPGPSLLEINMHWVLTAGANNHKVVLKLQHCYISYDSLTGKSLAPRGVQLDFVEMSK